MIKTPSDYNGASKPESRFMIKRIPMPHTTMHNYYTNESTHQRHLSQGYMSSFRLTRPV
jgi:hypothetical protein